MNRPLPPQATLAERKLQARLRLATYRQQLVYQARSLSSPRSLAKYLLFGSGRRHGNTKSLAGTPLWVDASALVLGLFAKRLGLVGRLARLALNAYPLLSKLRPPR